MRTSHPDNMDHYPGKTDIHISKYTVMGFGQSSDTEIIVSTVNKWKLLLIFADSIKCDYRHSINN